MENKKKKFGIQAKLMIFILPAVAAAFILLILLAFQSFQLSIQEKTEKLMEAEGKAGVNEIDAWASKNLAVLDTAVKSILDHNMSEEEILDYETLFLGTYKDFPNGLYIVNEDNKILDASGWNPDEDLTQRTWYKEGITHKNGMTFGEAYMDEFTREYVVTASMWIDNLHGRTAIAAADINLSILSEVVNAMKIEGDGSAFILDASTGAFLTHPDTSLIGKNVKDQRDTFYRTIYDQIKAGRLETASYDSLDGTYMVSIKQISGTNWYIISRGLEKNIYSDLYSLGTMLGTVGVFVVLVIIVLLTILIRQITKPISKLTDTIISVTDGDFTTNVEVKGNDEVTVMAGNMRRFLVAMREILGAIVNISEHIDQQAKESSQISRDLYQSAEGQATAMGQMRSNLKELVDSISVIAENATKLALVVSDTNTSGKQALDNISTTMKEADGGRASMKSVTASMSGVKNGMEMLERSITDVGEAAVKIDEITTTIGGIAEETNLLALNASIEAARAGEAGKGFAVVATQIKKLAETSAEAAREISQLINSVTSRINETVEQSHSSMEQINTSADMVYTASDQFNSIYESIESTNRIIQNMIQKIYDANDVATNMAAITEEQSASAAEIETTAVNIQKLADVVTENSAGVAENSNTLAVTAEDLKERISKFKIN